MSQVSTTSEQTVYSAEPDTIRILPKRLRQNFDKKRMDELTSSMRSHGQLQPGVCFLDNNQRPTLIMGERRLRACSELELPFLYILREEIIDEFQREEMELHENIIRENLTFLEEAQAKARLHALYMKHKGTLPGKKKGWSLEQSAQTLGVSVGNLYEDIELAKFASAVPEVSQAKNKSEAKKIVTRLKAGVLRSEALRRPVAAAPKEDTCAVPTAEGEGKGEEKSETQLAEEKAKRDLAYAIQAYQQRIHQGPMEETLLTFPEEHFNVVFFDPPWGVEFDKVYRNTGSQQNYQDSRRAFFQNLRRWLKIIYSRMNPNSHLYMKFSIVNYFFVYQMLRKTGFTVDGIPILWYKVGCHRIAHAHRWPGRCYEPIAFAHKGKKVFAKNGAPNIIPTPPPSVKLKADHPSAMHPLLIREILKRSAFPGDKFLDPMAGSCMSGVAADSLKRSLALDWHCCELEENFCNLGVANLVKGYDYLVKKNEFDMEKEVNTAPDFRAHAPGSPEWQRIWTEHPDQRDAMIAWQEGEKEE